MQPVFYPFMRYIYFIAAIMVLASCSFSAGKAASAASETAVEVKASFNGDSAYSLVKKQVEMGPRVPGTAAHAACAEFLEAFLGQYCDTAFVQRGRVTTWDNTPLDISNIIGVINPAAERRILLLAHWDCRPWADHDPVPGKRRNPVPGANDGASGVAVLLQLAREFSADKPAIGVDILLVDAEDWGNPGGDDDSWALGTQFWTASPHRSVSEYQYAILLDMVGTHNARFKKDYYSMAYAPDVMNFVWQTARENGLGDFFVNEDGFGITDDHLYINRAGIKCIDIIDQNNSGTGTGFFPQWHTTADDMGVISAATLRAVGTCLKALIGKY